MTKQMNEYVLLMDTGDATPLPTADADSFRSRFNQWAQANGMGADVIRTETAQDASVHLVCTEEVAVRAVEALGGVASIQMRQENVITIPDDMPKKARRTAVVP